MKKRRTKIELKDALRVKSAEFWLKLGQPLPALLELREVSEKARRTRWANRVLLSAVQSARESL